MKANSMESAPKDGRPVLIKISGDWIQGTWFENQHCAYWKVITCDSHGCGCCSGSNDEPTAWAELPEE